MNSAEPSSDAVSTLTTWRVERHGGRATDTWRLLYSGSVRRARQKYDKTAVALRQGSVRLLNEKGELLMMTRAPTLRTKW